MAIFKRKNTYSNVLPEVESYYAAEKRERSGLAWLAALASVAFAAALILGLFFGGRWIYRRYIHKPATTISVKDTTKKNSDTDNKTSTSPSNNQAGSNSGSTSSSQTSSTAVGTATGTTASGTASSTGSQNASSITSTSLASGDQTKLTNTGPESTLPAFILTSVLGTIFYRQRLQRSKSVR